MKIFFQTRDKARSFAKGSQNATVNDSKSQPSANGSRWAVQIKRDSK